MRVVRYWSVFMALPPFVWGCSFSVPPVSSGEPDALVPFNDAAENGDESAPSGEVDQAEVNDAARTIDSAVRVDASVPRDAVQPFDATAVNAGPSTDVTEDISKWRAGVGDARCGAPDSSLTVRKAMMNAVIGDAVRVDYPAGTSEFYLRYPNTNAGWDLRTRTRLDLFIDGRLVHGGTPYRGWSGPSPIVVLCSRGGGSLSLTPNMNRVPTTSPIDGTGYQALRVPLSGDADWMRFATSNYRPEVVDWIEFRADPDCSSCIPNEATLWLDDVKFY